MPELPEVEIVCRGIKERLRNKPRIVAVQIRRRDLRVKIPAKIEKLLVGEELTNIRRRAKYILFDTSKLTIINHLGMSGSWRFTNPVKKEKNDKSENRIEFKKHDHCCITFEDGLHLIFHDPRRFGLIDSAPLGQESKSNWLKHLGVEPLSEKHLAHYLFTKSKGKKVPVKNYIMDQRIVVGVGNIYASEALYKARIRPTRPVNKVSELEWQELAKSIKSVLNQAIKSGGTTLRNYTNAQGRAGLYKSKLLVYGREDEQCLICQDTIISKVLGGRSTFWCKTCQK